MMYVSCATGDIYRNGSWFDDAALLNEFSNGSAVQLAPEIVCELYPPYSYARGPLTLFGNNAEAMAHVGRIGQDIEGQYTCGSGSVLARAPSAFVSRTVVYLTDQDKPRVVYETHRPNDRPILPLRSDDALRIADRYFKADPLKVYLWIGSAGSVNYGHWLIDDLPRLKALSALRRLRPEASIVIVTLQGGALHEQVHMDTCAMISDAESLPPIEMIFVDSEDRIYFEELYFVTPVSNHPVSKSPDALDYVARSALSIPMTEEDAASLPKRIFVGRSPSGSRDLVNQPEVEQFLTRNGFISLDTATMPFKLQAGLFRNADMIIGCMGASMTNTVFSRPGTGVGYLAPDGWVEPFYWDLAAVRGHRYAACYGRCTSSPEVPWKANYHIDLGHLGSLMESIGAVS